MKKLLTVILALLTFGPINAQNSLLNLKETSILINGISVNVVHTMLKGDIKDINKSWSSFIKTHLKERMREDNGVLVLKETVVNQITDKRGDLLVYIYNIDNEASFNIAYKLGYDVYLNSTLYADEFQKMKEFANYFVYNYYNDYLPKYIKDKNKNLKVLTKEKKAAEKSIKKSTKNNNKNLKKINKYEKKSNRYDTKIGKSNDEASKTKMKNKQKEQNDKIVELKRETELNSNNIKTQETLISALSPKIEFVTTEINSANITLIEVRSKVKKYK